MATIIPLSKEHFSCIRIALIFVLILNVSGLMGWGQVGTVEKIKIVIVSGEGAVHRIDKANGLAPVVQVQDAKGQPIAGASVLFIAPDGGPGAVFGGGLNTLRVVTDEKGMAAAKGLQPNSIPGEFKIRIEASYQGQTAANAVAQTNVKKGSKTKTYTIIGILAGAGAGVGLAMKGKGGGDNTTPPPDNGTTISQGSIDVGPPPQ